MSTLREIRLADAAPALIVMRAWAGIASICAPSCSPSTSVCPAAPQGVKANPFCVEFQVDPAAAFLWFSVQPWTDTCVAVQGSDPAEASGLCVLVCSMLPIAEQVAARGARAASCPSAAFEARCCGRPSSTPSAGTRPPATTHRASPWRTLARAYASSLPSSVASSPLLSAVGLVSRCGFGRRTTK